MSGHDEIHRQLAFRLLAALRTIQLHGGTNAASIAAVQRLRASLEQVFPPPGQLLSLFFVDGVLLVNEHRVTARRRDEEDIAPLRAHLLERGLGGLRFARVPTAPALAAVLWLLAQPPSPLLGERLRELGDLGVEGLAPQTLATRPRERAVEVSTVAFALGAYGRAVVCFRELVRALEDGRDPWAGRLPAPRVVRDLVAVVVARPQHLAFILERHRRQLHALADGYAEVHAANTCAYALLVGRLLGLDRAALLELGVGALIADTGFALLPPDIAERPGAIAPVELERLHQFMRRAAEPLLFPPRGGDAALLRAAMSYEHHRPFRDSPGQTLLSSRVVQVADAFDALTSHRPWRPARPEPAALAELRAASPERFDPLVLGALEGIVRAFARGVERASWA